MMRTLLFLGVVAASSVAQANPPDLGQQLARDERALLHKQLSPASLSTGLRGWDAEHRVWQKPQSSGQPSNQPRLLVVNLWAHYCKPCSEEFPWLKEMARRIERKYNDQVRFLFVSETASEQEMRDFIDHNPDTLPPADHVFLDGNEAIAETLRHALPAGRLSLPVTVLIDERRIVRHVIIGGLVYRRNELAGAIIDLMEAGK